MENKLKNTELIEDTNTSNNSLVIPHYIKKKIKNKQQEYINRSQIVNLNTKNLPGVPTLISGKIYTKDNQPVPNAKIEIWHADDVGAYHNENHLCFPSQTTLSGFVITDSYGAYSIHTIRPGIYGYRARHFHYRISAKGHTTLETQIYFKDDPRILIDEVAIIAEDCRIVDFNYSNTAYLEGTVN